MIRRHPRWGRIELARHICQLFDWLRPNGANLRRLSADWQARYSHPVLLAETFVDTARFHGGCYRASNWVHVGQTKGWSKRGSRDGASPQVHLLSAIMHGCGVVIAQTPVPGKTNEITCVDPLLRHLDIEGCVVSADVLHTQQKTAQYLVEDKQADSLFTVKENQATLREDIADLHMESIAPSG